MPTDELPQPVVPHPMPLEPLPARPLVSVLIANYNYAAFLPVTLDALLAQTYDHFEAVICDDGSTDGSVALIQAYADRDARFHLVRKPNGGQTSAVNECFTHLSGDVVCLLDADDVFAPEKISRVVAAFAADPAAGMCNHPTRVVDALGQTILERLNPNLDAGWLAPTATERGACVAVPVTSGMSFRRQVLAALIPLPSEQRRDCDGYLGMAAQFLAPFAVVDEALSDYRIHGHNMGGLTEPTPERLHYELTLIAERTTTLQRFLTHRFGLAYAERIRVTDNPQYVQAALKMHAVDPENADVRHLDVASLIARHPNPKWRAMWKAIFATPRPLRRHIVPALHRSYRLKALAQKLFTKSSEPAAPPVQPPSALFGAEAATR